MIEMKKMENGYQVVYNLCTANVIVKEDHLLLSYIIGSDDKDLEKLLTAIEDLAHQHGVTKIVSNRMNDRLLNRFGYVEISGREMKAWISGIHIGMEDWNFVKFLDDEENKKITKSASQMERIREKIIDLDMTNRFSMQKIRRNPTFGFYTTGKLGAFTVSYCKGMYEVKNLKEEDMIIKQEDLEEAILSFYRTMMRRHRLEMVYNPPDYHYLSAAKHCLSGFEPRSLKTQIITLIKRELLKHVTNEEIEQHFAVHFEDFTCNEYFADVQLYKAMNVYIWIDDQTLETSSFTEEKEAYKAYEEHVIQKIRKQLKR